MVPMGVQTQGQNTAGRSLQKVIGTSLTELLVHKTHLDVGFPKGCQAPHLLIPKESQSDDAFACKDTSLEAHVDDGEAQLASIRASRSQTCWLAAVAGRTGENGKMGGNGGKWGKLEKKGGKWGEMGGNGGKWGEMEKNGEEWGETWGNGGGG